MRLQRVWIFWSGLLLGIAGAACGCAAEESSGGRDSHAAAGLVGRTGGATGMELEKNAAAHSWTESREYWENQVRELRGARELLFNTPPRAEDRPPFNLPRELDPHRLPLWPCGLGRP